MPAPTSAGPDSSPPPIPVLELVRIRVLALLSRREHAVSDLLSDIGIEPAHLSQQLAVLRRANLVVALREGSAVHYSLTNLDVAELLRVARTILSGVLADQAELPAGLRAAETEGGPQEHEAGGS